MSAAFKCDRCGKVQESYAVHLLRGHRDYDLCTGCVADFDRWMRREPTNVLMPKEDPKLKPQDVAMRQLRTQSWDY
jgi:hypothetical protein